MEFGKCAHCHLTLPRKYLAPAIFIMKGKKHQVLLCEVCRDKIKKAQKSNAENKAT